MMVLYQSLIRNLFRALYNLSVSVLWLLASVLAKAVKCQQEGPEAVCSTLASPGTAGLLPGAGLGPWGGEAKFQHRSPGVR